jgi:hypothetical protein
MIVITVKENKFLILYTKYVFIFYIDPYGCKMQLIK